MKPPQSLWCFVCRKVTPHIRVPIRAGMNGPKLASITDTLQDGPLTFALVCRCHIIDIYAHRPGLTDPAFTVVREPALED